MSKESTPIQEIYNESNDFVLIGLTGRTGSGCSTVAKMLERTKFNDLQLLDPKTIGFEKTEERKYKIVYDYAKENWDPFQVIEVKNVIASYI